MTSAKREYPSRSYLHVLATVLGCSPISMSFANDAPVDFTGIWMPTQIGPGGERNQVFPEALPFLPEVQARNEEFLADFDHEVDDSTRSCLPYGMPRQMLTVAQYPTEIIQTEDRITILVELHNDVRRIYLDGRAPPDGLRPTWMGYSVGRWEGESLVVTTTDIREQGLPRPQSRDLTLQERFTFIEGQAGPMIELEITHEDPRVYSRPFTLKTYYRQYEGLEMGEYFCNEDVWRLNLDGNPSELPWR